MKLFSFVLVAGLMIGCGDTIIHNDRDSLTGPSPTPTQVTQRYTIEFRVSGNATSARIRFSNPVDGLTQVTTTLPYVVSTVTTQPSMFLSLEVVPISFSSVNPFISAQIFVNGVLFREASSVDYFITPLSISGTWRSGVIQTANLSD